MGIWMLLRRMIGGIDNSGSGSVGMIVGSGDGSMDLVTVVSIVLASDSWIGHTWNTTSMKTRAKPSYDQNMKRRETA